MARCTFSTCPLLQGCCVSRRWRCGVAQIFNVPDEPSSGIARVRGAGSVVRRKSSCQEMNLPHGSCASTRWRCGAVQIVGATDEPSAGIVCVASLMLWLRAHFLVLLADEPSTGIVRVQALPLWIRAASPRASSLAGEPFCGDAACPSESPINPLHGSCASSCWHAARCT